ncbi:chemotaxis protein CheW [cf. Phormidesmis sp. LEGE 11477]|uniref:chemotaxis protein CheW n=1 Tax=cf. Phormidesmis sp. LEGE 11477 TaxID=1828680 RepID=UPI00187FC57D|nr:chemotaxis protein CheW [cf. Phormidesmis sp. LEGE 11477]MBE9060970.1 chemotaxis protein CheW [cf. Phormidesmis sp. LEGE 11477]
MLLTEDDNRLQSLNPAIALQDPLGLSPLPKDNRKRFLKFVLSSGQQALLPLSQVLEVMQLPSGDILPIPDIAGCIMGVCVWKGETLWIVDLNHLAGYDSPYQESQLIETLNVIVVQDNNQTLGLVVEQVSDIDLFDEEKVIKKAGLCSPGIDPFVLGHLPQQDALVLKVSSILNAQQLHAYHKQL